MNFLIIDDDKIKINKYKQYIYESQDCKEHNICIAMDLREARRKLIEKPKYFDQIILDYFLPENKTGIDVLNFIFRDNKRHKTFKENLKIIPNSNEEEYNIKLFQKINRLIIKFNKYK